MQFSRSEIDVEYIKAYNANLLKGQCHEIFDFFYKSVSPKPLSIPLGLFQILMKIDTVPLTLFQTLTNQSLEMESVGKMVFYMANKVKGVVGG